MNDLRDASRVGHLRSTHEAPPPPPHVAAVAAAAVRPIGEFAAATD